MNPYNFSVLFFSFGCFFLSLLVLLKRKDRIGLSFFAFCMFVAIWGVGYSILTNASASYSVSLFGARLCNASALFIPATWVHFIFIFLDCDSKKKHLLYLLYGTAFLILPFSFSNWFVPSVGRNVIHGFLYYTQAGPLFHVFALVFLIVVPYGFFELVKAMKSATGEILIQIRTFVIATLFGFLGGFLTFAPIYGLNIPQYGIFLMPLYPFIMAYAMIRHRLFDLEQIIQSFQKEKLATIGLIAASINHEIRNPLYAARGILENFKEGVSKKSVDEVTDKTLTQINRALDVITKLNRFAKPATDSIAQDSKASISEALQNVLGLISYEFELDKIHIESHVSESLPLIQIDQRHLEEVLFNLIVNACYAMKGQGGTLTLNSKLEINKLILEIQDTGTGISQEHLKHLFEPFHTTKGEKGTGLGLYITKQLVERNNGKITVQSGEGKGTSFILEFKVK